MLYLSAVLIASFALSVLPAEELPGNKHIRPIFWSTNPVIAENL